MAEVVCVCERDACVSWISAQSTQWKVYGIYSTKQPAHRSLAPAVPTAPMHQPLVFFAINAYHRLQLVAHLFAFAMCYANLLCAR